jgi:hypothetical protein
MKEDIEVNQTEPDLQECKILILHMIGQAVKDYEYYRNKTEEEEIEIHKSAQNLLFNDSYKIDWGTEEVGQCRHRLRLDSE